MDEPWTPLRVLEWTTARFAERGIEAARLEAQLLLAHALGMSRVELYTQFDKPLGKEELAGARAAIKRRLGGEPLAYLLGEQEFWSLRFVVDRRVLIPRRDTETLIEVVLGGIADRAAPIAVLDVATGAGPIAVALAMELKAARVIATDVSAEALAVARLNVERHGVGDRIELRLGGLLAPIGGGERFAVLAANLPYVARGDIDGLAPEVRAEPRSALDGGVDGLELVRALMAGAHGCVEAGGMIALEHGADQATAVREVLAADPRWAAAVTTPDLAGRPRITSARRV